ncbi:MAG: NADPH-dependent F420 reductase [Nocardioidaceae bacterium]
MTSISIIGNGTMGQAIAGIATTGGNDIQLLGSSDDSPITGEMVVLAVPYGAVESIVKGRGAELDGKVVVDITNPMDLETFDSLVVPSDSSAAAEIAAQLPGSRVVKAFNTTFGSALVAKQVGPVTTTVLLAGDDAGAKALVASVVEGGGLRAIDAGSLKRARELEAVGFLQILLAANERVSWTGGLAVVA